MPDCEAYPYWRLNGSPGRCVIEEVSVAVANLVPSVFFGRQRSKRFSHCVKVGLSSGTNYPLKRFLRVEKQSAFARCFPVCWNIPTDDRQPKADCLHQ